MSMIFILIENNYIDINNDELYENIIRRKIIVNGALQCEARVGLANKNGCDVHKCIIFL